MNFEMRIFRTEKVQTTPISYLTCHRIPAAKSSEKSIQCRCKRSFPSNFRRKLSPHIAKHGKYLKRESVNCRRHMGIWANAIVSRAIRHIGTFTLHNNLFVPFCHFCHFSYFHFNWHQIVTLISRFGNFTIYFHVSFRIAAVSCTLPCGSKAIA